jgi:hypothetical protein
LAHPASLAFSLALFNAGNNIDAKIAIIAITTSNSMSVKRPWELVILFISTSPYYFVGFVKAQPLSSLGIELNLIFI